MCGGLRIVFPMKVERKASLVAPAAAADTPDTPIAALLKQLEERCYVDLVEACRYVKIKVVYALHKRAVCALNQKIVSLRSALEKRKCLSVSV